MLDKCDVLPVTGSSTTPLVLLAITLIAVGAAVSWRWRAGRALYALAAMAVAGGVLVTSAPATAADDDCPPAATAPAAPAPTNAPEAPTPTGGPAPSTAPAPTDAPTTGPSTTGAPGTPEGFCLNVDGGTTSVWVFIYGDWGTVQSQNSQVADCGGDSGVPEAIYPNDSSCEDDYRAVPAGERWDFDDPGALAGWYACLHNGTDDTTTTTAAPADPPTPEGLCVVDGDGFYVLFPSGDEPSATASTFRASNGGCLGEVWQSVTFYRSGDCPSGDPWPVNFVLDPTPPVPDDWFYCLATGG